MKPRTLQDGGGKMKIICYKCDKEIGEKAPFSDLRATHSLCYECLKELLEKRLNNRPAEGQSWRFDPDVTSMTEF